MFFQKHYIMSKQSYMGVCVGDTIRITKLDDTYDNSYVGREGKVTHIDDMGQLHGTWGGLAVIPEVDEYLIIGRA